jgi:hypothetical protein
LALATLVVAVATFPRQRDAGRVAPWALAAAVPLTFALIGLDRAGFGVDQAASSRYVYIGVVLVVPLVGVLAGRLPHGVVGSAAVAALVAVALVVNVGRLVDQAHRSEQRAMYVRDAVVAAASLDGLDAADPMARPEPRFSPDLTLAALATMVDEGRIPRQRDLDPARRTSLATDYLVWLARPGDQAPMAGAVLAAATRGRLGPHRQGCQLATPAGGSAAWRLRVERPVRWRLAGLKAGTPVTVTVRDPASGVAAPPRALVVPWASPADLTIATVGLDVDVSVAADAEFTICTYEPGRAGSRSARRSAFTAG